MSGIISAASGVVRRSARCCALSTEEGEEAEFAGRAMSNVFGCVVARPSFRSLSSNLPQPRTTQTPCTAVGVSVGHIQSWFGCCRIFVNTVAQLGIFSFTPGLKLP